MRYINRCVERMERRGLGKGSENRSILEEVLITGDCTVACVVAIDMLHAGIDTVITSKKVPQVPLGLTIGKIQRRAVLVRVERPVARE